MPEFQEALKQLAVRVNDLRNHLTTEEATKTSLILPFFQLLGYDIFNPLEFLPEFTADFGIKKGERVDYAIMKEGNPVVLIECKSCTDSLDSHAGQIFRYYATTTAKFGILTNGIVYRFFTDLESSNRMDDTPFLEINLLDIKKNQIPELLKFHKSNFDIDTIVSTASDLKYMGLIQSYFSSLLKEPTDEFVSFLLASCYEGKKTQHVISQFKPIVKRTINQYINDILNEKISAALENENSQTDASTEEPIIEDPIDRIITTADELECYFVVKAILSEKVDPSRIVQKDTESYFGILLDNNTRKWICRIYTLKNKLALHVQNEDKSVDKFEIHTPNDIYSYKKELTSSLENFLD